MKEKNDNYPTPQKLADAIVKEVMGLLPIEGDKKISTLEPGCGDRAPFLKALETYPIVESCEGLDLRKDIPVPLTINKAIHNEEDFLNENWANKEGNGPWEMIITNPPYSRAQEFIETSLNLVAKDGLVVMLLQTGFEGSRKRVEFFEKNPWLIKYNIRPRPGFVRGKSGSTSDMREYAVYVWAHPEITMLLKKLGRAQSEVRYITGEGSWKSSRR